MINLHEHMPQYKEGIQHAIPHQDHTVYNITEGECCGYPVA